MIEQAVADIRERHERAVMDLGEASTALALAWKKAREAGVTPGREDA